MAGVDLEEEEEIWSDFRDDLRNMRQRAARLRERVGGRLGAVEVQDAMARELAALEAAGRTTQELLLAKLEEEWAVGWRAEWERRLREEKERAAEEAIASAALAAAQAARLREEAELKRLREKQRLHAGGIASSFAAIGDIADTVPHKWMTGQGVSQKLLSTLVEAQRAYMYSAAMTGTGQPATAVNGSADKIKSTEEEEEEETSSVDSAGPRTTSPQPCSAALDDVNMSVRALLARELTGMGVEISSQGQGAALMPQDDEADTGTNVQESRPEQGPSLSGPGASVSAFAYADAVLAPMLEEALREARAADRETALAGA